MGELRRTWILAGNNIKKWFSNPRIYILLILVLGYSHYMENGIKALAQDFRVNISPYLFPFLMGHPYSGIILLLLAVLLFCDAPFIEQEHPYLIMRTGRKRWYAGQAVYIAVGAALYTVWIGVTSVLVMIPNLEFTARWGKVIHTLAQTAAASQYGIPLPFDYMILQQFTPMEAMGIQFLLCWLLCMMVGNLMFVINLMTSRAVGAIAAVGVIFFQKIASDISPTMLSYSPTSWISMENLSLDGTGFYPSILYAVAVLTVINLLLILAAFCAVGKKDIEVLKNV